MSGLPNWVAEQTEAGEGDSMGGEGTRLINWEIGRLPGLGGADFALALSTPPCATLTSKSPVPISIQ